MKDIIRLMDTNELEKFELDTKREMRLLPIHRLETSLRLNQRLKQQLAIRISVIEEILDGRDWKAKQFKDGD